jgi:hypothetical protein
MNTSYIWSTCTIVAWQTSFNITSTKLCDSNRHFQEARASIIKLKTPSAVQSITFPKSINIWCYMHAGFRPNIIWMVAIILLNSIHISHLLLDTTYTAVSAWFDRLDFVKFRLYSFIFVTICDIKMIFSIVIFRMISRNDISDCVHEY